MVLTEKQEFVGTPPSARAHPGKKPPSEKPVHARFRVTSQDGSSRELPLSLGEPVQFLNRRITLVSALPEEDSISLSSPPVAEVSFSHLDGTGKNTFSVEQGGSFQFGQYTFTLEKVE